MRSAEIRAGAWGVGAGESKAGGKAGKGTPTRFSPRIAPALALALAHALGGAAAAQIPREDALPRATAEAIIAVYNRPETIRLTGESWLARGSELVGDVVVLGGPVLVGGRVRGSLVVVNGDLRLEPGADIEGDLTVVGGGVTGLDSARVAGQSVVHPEPLRYRREDGRLVYLSPAPPTAISAGREFGFGRTDLTASIRGSYNRVEGLPISIGPRVRFGGSNPTRLEAQLIYRSESGLSVDSDELGYTLRAEQYFGAHQRARIGARLFSEIDPIEEWGLSNRENSLATFLFHQDFRDYYERTGWGAYFGWAPRGSPTRLLLEYRQEEHERVLPREPWSLFENDEAWRPQPTVAEGRLRSLSLAVDHDTRNEDVSPSAGWLVRIELERGLGGTLAHNVLLDSLGQPSFGSAPANDRFLAAFVDVRRYARLGPSSRLAVRALAAGSLDGDPLPPQRQHALGGEGSLPGYRLFDFDCGARRTLVPGPPPNTFDPDPEDRIYPFYGCDRAAVLQLEYTASFPAARRLLRRWLGPDVQLGESPAWLAFFNAGRAWNEPRSKQGRGGGQNDFSVDAGLGLRLGRIGFYWAVPLSGSVDRLTERINFFVRVGPSF